MYSFLLKLCIITVQTFKIKSSSVMVNQVKETNSQNSSEDNKVKAVHMPTLDQFMELITNENKSVTATPSGYNVYNKYHKSS